MEHVEHAAGELHDAAARGVDRPEAERAGEQPPGEVARRRRGREDPREHAPLRRGAALAGLDVGAEVLDGHGAIRRAEDRLHGRRRGDETRSRGVVAGGRELRVTEHVRAETTINVGRDAARGRDDERQERDEQRGAH